MLTKLLTFALLAFLQFREVKLQSNVNDDDVKMSERWPHLHRIKSNTANNSVQQKTVLQLIGRVLNSHDVSDKFEVSINASLSKDGRDLFILETVYDDNSSSTATQKLRISANTGVSASAGFHYYLKRYCECHISWSGKQCSLNISQVLPVVKENVTIVANDMFRYYENVCTSSYSFVWWNWTRWIQEIDWMALNWINLPLAFNGQEEIYYRVYKNLTANHAVDLDDFFAGPAFLAWQRMGNIDRFGGPLPKTWRHDQLKLQHHILHRMRNFGMIPVLPAFSGHVPASITKVYPNVNLTRLGPWNGFNYTYLLDFNDKLFQRIGSSFIREMMAEFKVNHIYSADTFNEMTPPSSDPSYIAAVGRTLYKSISEADPDAVWLMQGWLFLNSYWTVDLAKALVTSVPTGRMLILDLHSDIAPLYQKFESYFGQPFIWCMLQNFGGTKGLYGSVDNINTGPFVARNFTNTTVVGTGLTPEGIEQNDVMFELMNEMAWRRNPVDLDNWVENYALRRYGVHDVNVTLAWQILMRTAYNCSSEFSFRGQYRLVVRPSFAERKDQVCYDKLEVRKAWELLVLSALGNVKLAESDLFQHDLVDVTREYLVAIIGEMIYDLFNCQYKRGHLDDVKKSSCIYLNLLEDLERLLATDRRFLLGVWLESAKELAHHKTKDEQLYAYNARNQITLWGSRGEILDYAVKQWSGVISDYVFPRWALFFNETVTALNLSVPFNQTLFNQDVFSQVEEPFTFSRQNFTTVAQGSVIDVVFDIYSVWSKMFIDLNDICKNCSFAKVNPKTNLSSQEMFAFFVVLLGVLFVVVVVLLVKTSVRSVNEEELVSSQYQL